MKTAHQVQTDVYARFGIDLKDVGCLMIDTESPVHGNPLDVSSAYVSPDPAKFWIKGLLTDWHLTARYGLLKGVTKDDVNDVLEGIELPETIKIFGTEVFASPYKDEPYECLVARVEDYRLTAINTALSILPNVNTFPEYKAHITIGYFKSGQIPDLKLKEQVNVLGLNYGHNL